MLADALLCEAQSLASAGWRWGEGSERKWEGLHLGAEEEEAQTYMPLQMGMAGLVGKGGGEVVLRLLEACGSERMGRRLAARGGGGDTRKPQDKDEGGEASKFKGKGASAEPGGRGVGADGSSSSSFVGGVVAALVRTIRGFPEALDMVSSAIAGPFHRAFCARVSSVHAMMSCGVWEAMTRGDGCLGGRAAGVNAGHVGGALITCLQVPMRRVFEAADAHIAMEMALTKASSGDGLTKEDEEECEAAWRR